MCCHFNIKDFFLLKYCTEVLLIISKILRNSVTVTSLLSWMAPFPISAVSRMCCHGNMNSPILLKFGTKVELSISNKIVLGLIEK